MTSIPPNMNQFFQIPFHRMYYFSIDKCDLPIIRSHSIRWLSKLNNTLYAVFFPKSLNLLLEKKSYKIKKNDIDMITQKK